MASRPRVLIACEFSGIVRDAFIACGYNAVSCDLLPSELPGPHIQGDVLNQVHKGWELMIAFPPCTYLCRSGARWHAGTGQQQLALQFVRELMAAPVPRIAIENPVGSISSHIRKPDLIIHPWEYGHGETKATCLWLKCLPPLMATDIVMERYPRIHRESPGPDRWRNRSRILPGIAAAMASQWGPVIASN